MTLSAPVRCSALADELAEPMIGTVEQRDRWLLIEDRGAWGHDAVGDVLGADRVATLKAAGVRTVLVRRREGDPAGDARRRVTLVDMPARAMATRMVASVDELDIGSLATGPIGEFGAPLSAPMFLVCSNGKRDACCALRGRALLAALGARHADRTWECTHLGGHRFAANLVCLPDGIVYGRVTPADGPTLADEFVAGRLEPAALRGRSSWPAPAQVAEQHVRSASAVRGLDDVDLISVDADADGERADVTLSVAGETRTVALRAERVPPPRPTSCRADETEEPLHWRVAGQ